MTVETTISKAGPYAGAGTVGPFPVPFRFLENSHLRVVKTNAVGVTSTLVLDTDYTVAGAGDEQGSVTLTAVLPVGFTLVVLRNVPATQEADYVENDPFPAESHEKALDKLTMLVQQQGESLGRALVMPESDILVDGTLPPVAQRARKYLSFDAGGRPVATTFDIDAVQQASDEAVEAAANAKQSEISAANSAIDAATWSSFVNQQVAGATPSVVRFSGTGSQTDFDLGVIPGAEENTQVYISGVYQQKDTYNVEGSTLSFSTAPPTGSNNIEVVIAPHVALLIGDADNISVRDGVGVHQLSEYVVDTRNHSVLHFSTRPEAVAALPLTEGQRIEIESDASHDGRRTRYVAQDDALTFVRFVDAELSGTNLSADKIWPDVPQVAGSAAAQVIASNAQAQALLNRTEVLRDFADHFSHAPLTLAGLNPIQVMAIPAPDSTAIPMGSRVNQGLYMNESTGVIYSSWLKNSDGDTLIRKLDFSGNTLAELTVPGSGGCGALYPVQDTDASTVYIYAGGYAYGGYIVVLKNDTFNRFVPFALEGRGGGTTFAVDTYDPQYGAMYYYKADGSTWIVPEIPVASLLAGGFVIDTSKAFQFTLPTGASLQTIGYYKGEVFILCGNDAISSNKWLLRYSAEGERLEQITHDVDRIYTETEGTIREPEGMCVMHDNRTGTAAIYTTVCFGTHAAPIIRTYKLQHGASGTAVHVEGYAGRLALTTSPPRIVDIPIVFSKVGANWTANNGSTVSASGKMTVKNIRVSGVELLFDLHKPYLALLGFSLSEASPMHEYRIVPAWTYVAGGSTSAVGQRITFFNPVTNNYVLPGDIPSGCVFCLTLRVAYGR